MSDLPFGIQYLGGEVSVEYKDPTGTSQPVMWSTSEVGAQAVQAATASCAKKRRLITLERVPEDDVVVVKKDGSYSLEPASEKDDMSVPHRHLLADSTSVGNYRLSFVIQPVRGRRCCCW